jgi:4-aminobutyrate aminotransferase
MPITCVKDRLPGPKSKELLERWHKYEADVVGFQAPLVWESAKGCVVTDVDGNRYIDWTSGVLVTNVGHCHPHLVEATQKASQKLLNNYECANEYRIEAAQRLVEAMPTHLDKCFFLSTGSEAIEAAIRLMKRKSGNFEIVSFEGGFHGRTTSSASLGGLPGPKRGYGPTVPGVIRVPFPNPYRDTLGFCNGDREFTKFFDYLEYTIAANSTGSLAGVITEPYQGAGGFIFPPEGWLKKLELWAHNRGLLFCLDEVQASYGRTGTMWAMEHEDVRPDIVVLGKGIGCGVPVSAVVATSDVFSCLSKGEMSSTLGGNPVASAAVTAVFDICEKENLVENAAAMGEYLLDRLKELFHHCEYLGDVRGRGLVMGMEFVKDKRTKEPAPELIKPLIEECAQNGLLVGSVGMYGNVIRVAPPLVITKEEIDESVGILQKVLINVKL